MWLIVERTDGVHVLPDDERHVLHLACPCVPAYEPPTAEALALVTHERFIPNPCNASALP